MQRQRSPLLLGSVLSAAGVMGAVWWADAVRRERYAARLHRATVDLLLNALTAGDAVTARHSRRVADLSDLLAAPYRLSREEHATLRIAALMHDMGKIDDRFFAILHSCRSLSPAERAKIQQHPHESAHILRPLEPIHPRITEVVEAHHECWDGNGYPRGLKGEEIPLAARIISVADVFDALTQPRPYHEPMPVDAALEAIREGAGNRFDPAVVERVGAPRLRLRWTELARAGRLEEEAALQREAAGERDGEAPGVDDPGLQAASAGAGG